MDVRKLVIASLLLLSSLACRYLIPNWEEPPTIISPPFESPRPFENEKFSYTIPAGWQTMKNFGSSHNKRTGITTLWESKRSS